MQFQLKEIVLWPKKSHLPPRRLMFQSGAVNVITGASRTGKSAIIPIIDYCLGANSCSIPVQTIRDACSWFGVIVRTDQGEKLFARREPAEQRVTDDVFILEGAEVTPPAQSPIKNATSDQVKRIFNDLCGLTRLAFSAEGNSGYSARPGFRDLTAFMYQPQNIIANPDVFFYKADTREHREKLRTIFPYVLDAVTPALLAKQHEHEQLNRELRRKTRELNEVQTVSQQWIADIQAKLSEAREFGLIDVASRNDMPREEMLDLLRSIVGRRDLTLQVTGSTISEALTELSGLENEEHAISMELTSLRRRLTEMNRLRDSSADYHSALQIQRDRLKITDWLIAQHTETQDCPICGHQVDADTANLRELHNTLHALESETTATLDIPVAFDREYQRVQALVQELSEKLKAVQLRRQALENSSSEAHQSQYRASQLQRFVGSLETAMRMYDRLGQDGDLSTEVARLSERVRALAAEIAAANIDQRKQRALKIVNTNAGRLLPHLDCERPDDPVSLNIDELTISVTSQRRVDNLSEIGSGSNWLSYHLAIMLGLHQFFLRSQSSVVPSFLAIDQPSQVYFPRHISIWQDASGEDPQLRDEDMEAVRKAFTVMAEAVKEAKGKLQLIVLDHAPEAAWGGIESVHRVDEWRGGNKLVPRDWL